MMEPNNTILHGDALAVLKGLPDECVQVVCTSPPYYSLRDYGVSGQIGLEGTPQEYIEKLVSVFREVRRVLRHDGTCWLNLGDSYVASKTGSDSRSSGLQGGKNTQHIGGIRPDKRPVAGLKPKDLMMIPARVAIALCEDGWYLRQDCIWHLPNAMPESVQDRPTTDYEHVFLLAKSERYFYDHFAVREEGKEWKGQTGTFARSNGKATHLTIPGQSAVSHRENRTDRVPEGRNKRAVWSINTEPFPGEHYATFPKKLAEVCILAGSRPGDVVLDPFIGAGTTALVAIQHHRNWLGIELNPDYIKLAEKRIATVQTTLWEMGAD